MRIFKFQDKAYKVLKEYPDTPTLDTAHLKKVWTASNRPEPLIVRGKNSVVVLELIEEGEFEDLPSE